MFNLILHGNIGPTNNFNQRVCKLAKLLNVDMSIIGPLLGVKESVVMSNLEFTEARRHMAKITNLGFKAEIRPTHTTHQKDNKTSGNTKQSDNLTMNQNRAVFKAPTDLPEGTQTPLKQCLQPLASSVGNLNDIDDTSLLAIVDDDHDDNFSKYNWSKDLDDDEVVRFNHDLVIKKGR